MKGKFSQFADARAALHDVVWAPWARHHGALRVEWPDDRRVVEGALRELPESSDWPGLFEVLMESRGPAKRVAVVFDRDGPMGVALLRSIGRSSWEVATRWIVPGFLFPVRPGCTYEVLKALQVRVDVGYWRYPEPPPVGPGIQNFRQQERHQLDCTTDFDAYWKESGNLSFVRQAQRRCKSFLLRIDPEGGAEWTICNWERKWRSDPNTPLPAIEDRVAAAKFLERLGRHHTMVLFDGERRIAGTTVLIHNGCVVCQLIFRVPEYNYHGVGTHITEAVFQWAKRSGYRKIDLGTGTAYKGRWAPATGEYTYWFTVPPSGMYQVLKQRAKGIMRHLAASLSSCTSRLFGSEGGDHKSRNTTGIARSPGSAVPKSLAERTNDGLTSLSEPGRSPGELVARDD